MNQRDGALKTTVGLPEQRTRLSIRRAATYLAAALCLAWVFHDTHPAKLALSLTTINWWWVALAVTFDILSYIFQGLRWRLLLCPVGNLTTLQATQAIYAGLFANEVLPMRFGELVRAFLASRWLSASFASIIPSMLVERLLDGVWLALAVGLAGLCVRLPRNILNAVDIFAAVVLACIGLFIYVVHRGNRSSAEKPPGGQPAWEVRHLSASFISEMRGGLRSIGSSRFLLMPLGLSLALLGSQALAFWLMMQAYGLPLPFRVGAVVFLIVHLGTVIPGAPANVGSYQFFTVVGLTLFGVDKTVAAGFSVVVFILLTIPLWVIGFFALGRSGMTLFAIRNQVSGLMSRPRPARQPQV
jgi:glycosyltransferase 2 family protein